MKYSLIPQMSPMNWVMILLMSFFSLFISMIMLNFILMNYYVNDDDYIYKKKQWKWLW